MTQTMSQTVENVTVWPLRTWPKDIGVALVVASALLLGLILRSVVEGRTRTFESDQAGFAISYPATWRVLEVENPLVLRVEDPQTDSIYKTNVTVEVRELDPNSPPTLQELVDRRVAQRGELTDYHFLSSSERTVAGARAAVLEYAHVAQPIDTPRRMALPVVVQSREYIVVTQNRTYYIALDAPADDFARASDQFDRIVQSVRIP